MIPNHDSQSARKNVLSFKMFLTFCCVSVVFFLSNCFSFCAGEPYPELKRCRNEWKIMFSVAWGAVFGFDLRLTNEKRKIKFK